MTKQELRSILADRTTTSFGVSIGTGLLLESLFTPTTERYDPDRVIPPKVDPFKYPHYCINIYTLIRNLLGSIKTTVTLDQVDPKVLVELVLEEILTEVNVLKSLTAAVELKEDWLVIYIPNYIKLIQQFNINKDTGLKQIQNAIALFNLYQPYLDKLTNVGYIKLTNNKLPSIYNNSLITTHYTLDLLNSNYLTLLESHTGILKDNHTWYTKYHPVGKEDLSRLPMSDIVLYILGDHTLVRGLGITVKKELLRVAEDKNWTYRTTREKIVSNLKDNEVLSEAIKDFKSY